MDIIKRAYYRLKRKISPNINLNLVLERKNKCNICMDSDFSNGIYICKKCTLKMINKTYDINVYLDKFRYNSDSDIDTDLSLLNYEFEN